MRSGVLKRCLRRIISQGGKNITAKQMSVFLQRRRECGIEQLLGAHKSLMPILLQWSITCSFCQCAHLSNASAGELWLCCQGGTHIQTLKPYPPDIVNLLTENLSHLRLTSSTYNNILSMCATGVANDHGGGFEKIHGDHCLKLNGSVYHFMPRATNSCDYSGGLSYFTFDVASALLAHAQLLNSSDSTIRHAGTTFEKVRPALLLHNQYARKLRSIGERLSSSPPELNSADMIASLKGHVDAFLEVGQVTSSVPPGGHRVISVA